MSLGYKELATMVVLYRNARNSVPAILRGSLNQKLFAGIFPPCRRPSGQESGLDVFGLSAVTIGSTVGGLVGLCGRAPYLTAKSAYRPRTM